MKPKPKPRRDDTSPGPGAVLDEAVHGLDAPLPDYSFERAQSDMADAAHHHAGPQAPPAPQAISVDKGGVQIAPTPVPSTVRADRDEIDEQMERARNAPSHTDLGLEKDLVRRMRAGELDGVSTDPSKRRRDRGALAALALVVAVGIAVFVAIEWSRPNPTQAPSATESTSAAPPATTTAAIPPSVTVPLTGTATASTTVPRPTVTLPPTHTVPTTTASTITTGATTAPPTTTATSFNPRIEQDF